MATGVKATFVISWAQTEADGYQPASPGLIRAGAVWRWLGDAMRVDAPRDILVLEGALGMTRIRQSASRMVGRLTGIDAISPARMNPSGPGRNASGRGSPAAMAEGGNEAWPSLVISDGVKCWTASILKGHGGLPAEDPSGWILVFEGEMPPRDELWIIRSQIGLAARAEPSGVICFTSGTRILTPAGVVQVEALRPGDMVTTRDNGAQEVLWTGQRRMSAARLYVMPHLRPVRICQGALQSGMSGSGMSGSGASTWGRSDAERPDGDLLVSPWHRILITGAVAQALFNTKEVLVRAGDLVDDHSIRTDLALREVTYHHLLLDRHEVLFANGVGADSFHPGEAGLAGLEGGDHARLMALMPDLGQDPMRYGDFARRGLSRAEAALLRHDATRS